MTLPSLSLRLSLLIALSAAALPLWGAEPAPTPASTAVASTIAPDPELLEFLADWQEDDGQWVDPMTFDRIDPARLAAHLPRHREKLAAPAPAPAGATGARPAHGEARCAR